MCRLILARGAFDSRQILTAIVEMSTGATADHDGPTRCHPNGWGALWRVAADRGGAGTAQLAVHRDARPLADSADGSPVAVVDTDFLAVHARHATVPANQGLEFTHPLVRHDPSMTWYFMHNGFLPTVHRLLGMPASRFDSAEYFRYAIPVGTTDLTESRLLDRLAAIPPGGSSGNAIAVNANDAYVIHWTPALDVDRRYFTMHRLQTNGATIISSEIIPALAPVRCWQPLPPARVLRFGLSPSNV